MSFLFEATINWGNDCLEATFDQLEEGEPGPPNSLYPYRRAPMGIPRSTFYKLLPRLSERGVLIVEGLQRKFTRFRVNLDWTPKIGVLSPAAVVARKRAAVVAAGANVAPEKSPGETIAGSNKSQSETPLKEGKSLLKEEREEVARPLRDHATPSVCLEEEGEEGEEDNSPETLPEERLSPADPIFARPEMDTVDGYWRTFHKAWQETYPGVPCPQWSGKTGHALKSTLRSRSFPKVEDRHDLLDFCVRNWPQLMSKSFARWMKGTIPVMPDVGFLANTKLTGHFLDAYAERARFEGLKMLSADAQELERMMAGGKTRDEAMLAIGQRHALSVIADKEREVRLINRETMQQAEAAHAKRVAEQRALLRERADLLKLEKANEAPEPFEELAHLPKVELVQLPAFDARAW